MSQNSDFVLAPLRLFVSDRLLSAAHPERLPEAMEHIADLDRAMLLENTQDLPDGYRIWADVVAGAVSGFYSAAAAKEGRVFIEAEGQRLWDARGEFERALQIKRMRKTITLFEEFWLTVAYDIFEMLKSVSLGRHVLGRENDPVLEAIHAVFDAGFYPCGWHREGRICVFDPRLLDGFKRLSSRTE